VPPLRKAPHTREDPEAPARDKVLFQLKMRGPQTAAQLARRLRVTPIAVRQHLRRLAEDGLVQARDLRRGVGRPARVFTPTAAAASRFPDTHAALTVELLESMRVALGEGAVDRLVAERTRRQLESYRTRLGRGPLERRVQALAALRCEEGYLAEVARERDGSFLLLENHCPICAAARACQGLCREELALFRRALGPDVQVERTEHLLAGARRCAYRITPKRRGQPRRRVA